MSENDKCPSCGETHRFRSAACTDCMSYETMDLPAIDPNDDLARMAPCIETLRSIIKDQRALLAECDRQAQMIQMRLVYMRAIPNFPLSIAESQNSDKLADILRKELAEFRVIEDCIDIIRNNAKESTK